MKTPDYQLSSRWHLFIITSLLHRFYTYLKILVFGILHYYLLYYWIYFEYVIIFQKEKFWTTQESDVERLREYKTKVTFKADHVDEFHKLQKPFYVSYC